MSDSLGNALGIRSCHGAQFLKMIQNKKLKQENTEILLVRTNTLRTNTQPLTYAEYVM